MDHITEIFQDKKLMDHFLFSSRLKFMENSFHHYQESTLAEKILGMGYIEAYGTDDVNIKMVEMDYMDIFFRHGILGFLLYMTLFFLFLKQAIKRRKKEKNKYVMMSYFLSYALMILLSFFTGHIITAPAVSLIVVILLTIPKGDNAL